MLFGVMKRAACGVLRSKQSVSTESEIARVIPSSTATETVQKKRWG
jgi:hypothetical protein